MAVGSMHVRYMNSGPIALATFMTFSPRVLRRTQRASCFDTPTVGNGKITVQFSSPPGNIGRDHIRTKTRNATTQGVTDMHESRRCNVCYLTTNPN